MPKTKTGFSTSCERKLRRLEKERRAEIAKCQTGVIENAVSVARAFGGFEALAEFMGYKNKDSVSMVVDWIVTGEFPTGWHMRFYWELIQRGHVVDPIALGWVIADSVKISRNKKQASARRNASGR